MITAELGAQWQREVDATVKSWQAEIAPGVLDSLVHQVQVLVSAGNPAGLAHMQVVDRGGADIVRFGMKTMAAAGVAAVLDEAAAAGLDLDPPPPAAAISLADWSRAAADLLGTGLALTAARAALQQWRPGMAATAVADGVRSKLGELTDRGLRDVVGGALTRALNLGKLRAYAQPHPRWHLALLADETLDSNTCKPCRQIDGVVLPSLDAALLAYGGGGYLFCEGGERCRGTVVGRWTQEPSEADVLHGELLAGLALLDPSGT